MSDSSDQNSNQRPKVIPHRRGKRNPVTPEDPSRSSISRWEQDGGSGVAELRESKLGSGVKAEARKHKPQIRGVAPQERQPDKRYQQKRPKGVFLKAMVELTKSAWTAWVGYRYLKSKKNSKFLSFITILSVGGVGIGVTAMVVVISVMDGFESELKKRLMATDLHVLITPTKNSQGFDRGFVPESALEDSKAKEILSGNPHVLSFWPIVQTEAILKSGRKVTGIEVKGVSDERLSRMKKQLVEEANENMLIEQDRNDTFRYPGIFVGQELAFNMGLIPGDKITLVSPTETRGPLGAVPRTKIYVVEGVYHSGFIEQELHTTFTQAKHVHSFLRKREIVSQWEITVSDFEQATQIANQLRPELSTFKIQDWKQLNANLFASLQLERVAMFTILAFIVIVASFNIITTLTLMVIEKKKEIAILRTIGAKAQQVAAIFLAEGLLIGLSGVGGGLVLGAVICVLLKRYEFIELPEIYYDRTLPVTFEPMYYGIIGIAALVIVIAACHYPSKRAANLNPLDGIRVG